MSLLFENMVDCTIMDKATTADGYGGVVTVWSEGAKIQAAIVMNGSPEAVIAQAITSKEAFTITTSRSVVFYQNDVIKRNSDGKYFRITSDGTEKKTPQSAGLDMRQVSAEEWRM